MRSVKKKKKKKKLFATDSRVAAARLAAGVKKEDGHSYFKIL
jgi:hypothetical protein